MDLRERLQAGLWLGELGDNLRYLRWAASTSAPDGAAGRVGICLHPRHWRGPGRPGQLLPFRIGDNRIQWNNKSRPEWTTRLAAARMAAYPVTVMECAAALTKQEQSRPFEREPSGLTNPNRNNPLMPVTGITWVNAMQLTSWYRPLYEDLFRTLGTRYWREKVRWHTEGWALSLPTEVQHEAWTRGPVRAGPPRGSFMQTCSADLPPLPLVFNHYATRWRRPNPVGVFSHGLNPWGLDDLVGNVWNWCSNENAPDALPDHRSTLLNALEVDEVKQRPCWQTQARLALRGGSFHTSAEFALAAPHVYDLPDSGSFNVGLRWQMSRLSSEP